jgi:hypothetical protein
MSKNNPSGPKQGASAEDQSGASGSNEAHGHSKPSEPGMTPGVGQAAAEAGDKELKGNEKENADLEQQHKETLTERD